MNVRNVMETSKTRIVSKLKFYIDIGRQCQKATRKSRRRAAPSRRRKSLDAWHDWKWQPPCVGQESYVEELTPEGSETSSLCRSGGPRCRLLLVENDEFSSFVSFAEFINVLRTNTSMRFFGYVIRVLLANYYYRRMIKESMSFRRLTYSE